MHLVVPGCDHNHWAHDAEDICIVLFFFWAGFLLLVGNYDHVKGHKLTFVNSNATVHLTSTSGITSEDSSFLFNKVDLIYLFHKKL